MPTPNNYSTTFTADVTATTTTETVVATLVIPAVPGPGYTVRLRGNMQFTTGAGTTAVTPRIRRGTDATGTLIGEANAVTATASTTIEVEHEETDTPGDVASVSYVLTIQQTAAAANGTALHGTLSATVG
jgi:hypothetical protein